MNLPGMSFAIDAPPRSFKFSSDNAIAPFMKPSSLSSSSGFLRRPFSTMFCSQGCVAVFPILASAENSENNKRILCRATSSNDPRQFDCARSTGSAVQRMERFRCAGLGQTGDGELEMGKTAGAESSAIATDNMDSLLVTGSPIVMVEAPVMLKTAEPMPMMRPNRGQIKPGDAGRVIDRRPKDLWAVRFAVGAYLIERKCFKPLDIQ